MEERKLSVEKSYMESGSRKKFMEETEEALMVEEQIAAGNRVRRERYELENAGQAERIKILKQRIEENIKGAHDVSLEWRKYEEGEKYDEEVGAQIDENNKNIAVNNAKRARMDELRENKDELLKSKQNVSRAVHERDADKDEVVKSVIDEIDSVVGEIGKEKGRAKHLTLGQTYRDRLRKSQLENFEAINEENYNNSAEAVSKDLELQSLALQASNVEHNTEQIKRKNEALSKLRVLQAGQMMVANQVGSGRTVDEELQILEGIVEVEDRIGGEKIKLASNIAALFYQYPLLLDEIRKWDIYANIDPRGLMDWNIEELRALDNALTDLMGGGN